MGKPQRRTECPGTNEQVRGDHGYVIQRERAPWEDCLLGAVGSSGGTPPAPVTPRGGGYGHYTFF